MLSSGSENRFKAITESRCSHVDHRTHLRDRRPVFSLLSKRFVDRCLRFRMTAFSNDQKNRKRSVCLVTLISNGRIAQTTPSPQKLLCANVSPTCLCLHGMTNVCLYTLLSEQWHTATAYRLHVTLSARKNRPFSTEKPTQLYNHSTVKRSFLQAISPTPVCFNKHNFFSFSQVLLTQERRKWSDPPVYAFHET